MRFVLLWGFAGCVCGPYVEPDGVYRPADMYPAYEIASEAWNTWKPSNEDCPVPELAVVSRDVFSADHGSKSGHFAYDQCDSGVQAYFVPRDGKIRLSWFLDPRRDCVVVAHELIHAWQYCVDGEIDVEHKDYVAWDLVLKQATRECVWRMR